MPDPVCPASLIARECQTIARQLADHQSDELKLSPGNVTRIVNAFTSAGNLLAGAAKIDPGQPAPAGFIKQTEFAADGGLVVIFTQEKVATPPPTEPAEAGRVV